VKNIGRRRQQTWSQSWRATGKLSLQTTRRTNFIITRWGHRSALIPMKRLAKQTPQIKALARTASRETVKLFSSRILRPGIGLVLVPAPQSTPGRFYQIKWGDTLFGITQRAYGRELNGKSPAHQRFSIQPPVLEGRSGVGAKDFSGW
jgi:hypothetical protein